MRSASRRSVTGHYAGPVNRAVAAAADVGVVLGTFTLGYSVLEVLLNAVFETRLTGDRSGVLAVVALVGWGFVYLVAALTITGRTVGKAVVGLRVVNADGSPLAPRRALLRTLLLPAVGLPLGLGFLPIILQRQHRGIHDLLAGTAVVYDWGERTAQLPGPLSDFIARHE